MMLVLNLAEPDWVSIPCNKQLLEHIFCYKNEPLMRTDIQKENDYLVCSKGHILVRKNCYVFLWSNGIFKTRYLREFNARPVTIQTITFLKNIFDATSLRNDYPTILIQKDVNIVYVVKFQRSLNKITERHSTVNKSIAKGFYTYQYNRINIIIGINLFNCTKGGYISSEYICDGYTDCPNDQSDERFCICLNQGAPSIVPDGIVKDKKRKTVCSNLYHMTIMGNYRKYKEIKSHKIRSRLGLNRTTVKAPVFNCNNGRIIDEKLRNDLTFDCGPEGEDEPILMSLLKHEIYTSCDNPDMIPCMEGHSKCYHLNNICTYEINLNGHLIPCRNGGHLQNCKSFECNLMFKCKNSYCISWIYVYDGKWDCPKGDDELNYSVGVIPIICLHMYKCKTTTHKCVHTGNVCDGIGDCPFDDDELHCSLKHVKCPQNCQCLILAVHCSFTLDLDVDILSQCLSFSISNSIAYTFQKLVQYLENAMIVRLPKNDLKDICTFLHREFFVLDVQYNNVTKINKHCFVTLWLIQALILNDNYITFIERGAFYNISNLKFLNLSNNPLLNLPENVLKDLIQFKLLFIVNVKLLYIHKHSLRESLINVIITSDFHLCCIISDQTLCPTFKPWYISCSDILPKISMKLFFVTVSSLIILLNNISILLHSLHRKTKKTYSMIVVSINVNDILCGAFLGCICITDIILKGKFSVKEKLWRSSPLCFTAFGIILWFTLLTQFVMIFLSLSRLMVVIHPMSTKFKKIKFILKSLVLAYIFTFLLGLLLTLAFKYTHKNVPIHLCLPFVDPSDSFLMIKVITWFVALSQTASSVIILIMHALLVKILKDSKRHERISKPSDDSSLIVHLIVITTSNIISWIPANGIYITAMFLPTYPTDLIIWTTVIGLPLNSVINPFIFIIASLRKYIKERIRTKDIVFN